MSEMAHPNWACDCGYIDHPWGPDDGKVWNHFWLHDRIQGKTLGERIATETFA